MKPATPQQLLLLVLHNRHRKALVKHDKDLSPAEKIQYSFLLRKHSPSPSPIKYRTSTKQENKQIPLETISSVAKELTTQFALSD